MPTRVITEWVSAADQHCARLARRGKPFTTDDIWAHLDRQGVPRPTEPREMGSVIAAAARAGIITETGDRVPSVRREAHRRPLTVWVGTTTKGVVNVRADRASKKR